MSSQPVRPRLSGQQRVLYEVLQEKDPELAEMYLGALTVLGKDDIPDQMALAAHDIRELMEKTPRIIEVRTKALRESLKVKVRELEDLWRATLDQTECHKGGNWAGSIDGPLSGLLNGLQAFFGWFVEHLPRRRAEIATTLRRLDGSGRTLPVPLENLNVDAWDKIRDFFVGVAHHRRKATQPEFAQWLDALERFLLDHLRPRSFADLDVIDEIVREGETHA